VAKSADTELSSLRVRPALKNRAKSLAALAGMPLADFAGELLGPALDKAERELSRLKGERPDRGRPIDGQRAASPGAATKPQY
jgi:hypothetical protein